MNEVDYSSAKTKTTTLTFLPNDIIFNQILSRLPVKILVKFSCVCKLWRNCILANQTFIRSHLQNQAPRHKFLLLNHLAPTLFEFPYNKGVRDYDSCGYREIPILVAENFKSNLYHIYLVGSSNGVLCVYCYFDRWRTKIYLWNPALRQCTLLPSTADRIYRHYAIGFGFDNVSQDYKVAKRYSTQLVYENYFLDIHKLDIYSLKKRCWKTVTSSSSSIPKDCRRPKWYPIPPRPPNCQLGVICNGCFIWIVGSTEEGYIRLEKVDIINQKNSFIVLPSYVPISCDHRLTLFKGYISISGYTIKQSGERGTFELWSMVENGDHENKPCWVKQFVFLSDLAPNFSTNLPSLNIFTCIPNGKVVSFRLTTVFEHYGQFGCFEINDVEQLPDGVVISNDRDLPYYYFFVDNYVESLVCVDPPSHKKQVHHKQSFSQKLFGCFVSRDK